MSRTLEDIYSKHNDQYNSVKELKSNFDQQRVSELLDNEAESSNETIRSVAKKIKDQPSNNVELIKVITKTVTWNIPNWSFFNVVDQLKNDQDKTVIDANYMRNLLHVDDEHNLDSANSISDDVLQKAAVQVQADIPFDFNNL